MQTTFELITSADPDAIVTTAPCRADLAGGTIDIWPLYLFHPGAVSINIALNILTACRITPRVGHGIVLKSHDTVCEDRFASLSALLKAKSYRHPLAAYLVRFFKPRAAFLLETFSESPAGAGISGSSALMIATSSALARFTGCRTGIEDIRVLAQNVEAQLIRVPTGCQDYYPAMYGGVSAIHLETGGVRREAIPVSLDEVDERFIIFYTGAPRQSGINNWQVFKQHIDGDQRVIRNFAEISRIAQAMHQAVAERQWDDVARLMREEWRLRRTNAPGIAMPFMDKLIAVAKRHGAKAAKVCGAGGGGCVIALIEPGAAQSAADAIRDAGGQPLDFKVARKGLTFHSPGKQQQPQT